MYLHAANGKRDVHRAAQPGEEGFHRTGKLLIGDVIEQREVQVFREPIVWHIDLLERRAALEGQAAAQRRLCDRQQCSRQYIVLFDGLVAETQPMGQARDLSGLDHESRPDDSLQGCRLEIDSQPPTRQVWAFVGQQRIETDVPGRCQRL